MAASALRGPLLRITANCQNLREYERSNQTSAIRRTLDDRLFRRRILGGIGGQANCNS